MKQTLVLSHRPCMCVSFLFLLKLFVSFIVLPVFNFETSEPRLVILYTGTIIMYYMYIHVHCLMASLDKFLTPHSCVILFNKR